MPQSHVVYLRWLRTNYLDFGCCSRRQQVSHTPRDNVSPAWMSWIRHLHACPFQQLNYFFSLYLFYYKIHSHKWQPSGSALVQTQTCYVIFSEYRSVSLGIWHMKYVTLSPDTTHCHGWGGKLWSFQKWNCVNDWILKESQKCCLGYCLGGCEVRQWL